MTTAAARQQRELEVLAEALEREILRAVAGKNCQAVGLALVNVVAKWLCEHRQGTEPRLMEIFQGMVLQGVPKIRELNWENLARQHPSASTPQ